MIKGIWVQTFNSLYGILKDLYQTEVTKIDFQFPLWDSNPSAMQAASPACLSIPFMGFCTTNFGFYITNMFLSIPFMGFYNNLNGTNPIKLNFQFPLWDSKIVQKLIDYNIIFQFPLWDS